MPTKRAKSHTKRNNRKIKRNTRSKRKTIRKKHISKRKHIGGSTSYIVEQYNEYKEKLMDANDVDKLRELENGIKLTNVLKELLGEENALRIKGIVSSGHIKTFLIYGDLNIKVFLDFMNFGLVYECDFTNDGETVVVHIKLAFPNNTFKTIVYEGDEEEATEDMGEVEKQIVYMFSSVREPNYIELMNIINNNE